MSTPSYTKEQMLAINGKAWRRGARFRIYLDHWHDWVELHIVRNDKGAILSASVLGEPIIPRRAGILVAANVFWEDGRLFYDDIASHSKHFFGDDRLVVALLAGIDKAVKGKGSA